MRLFLAVDIGDAAGPAAALLDELRRRAARLAPLARITWVPPDRLHLTVRFIGHVEAAQAEAIATVMEPPLTAEPFELSFAGAGAFPRSGRPQVLWVGVVAGEAALQEIAREVTARLSALGIPPEARRYSPHLTLARVRDAAGLRTRPLVAGLEQAPAGSAWCEAITLYESRLSPRGPAYLPLRRTPLRRQTP